MADELSSWHDRHPDGTARVGYCTDVAHAYVDGNSTVRTDHLEMLEATLPYLYELHLKNTDARYSSTFGFSPQERQAGIIQIEPVRRLLLSRAETIPVDRLVGYLELGGPKLGRDYSDKELEGQLRASLGYLKETWLAGTTEVEPAAVRPAVVRVGAVERPQRPVRVSPSMMCVDPGHMENALRQLEAAGADMLHLDMADGHFVPNLLLGLDVVRWLRPKTALPLDVHLMVDNPDAYVELLAKIGVDYVAVHTEVCRHLDRTLTEIRRRGMKAGVALTPATPLQAVEYVLERLDFVLLMTVNPGFAAQKLVASAVRKIADCHRYLASHHVNVPIMVDGNVSFDHIPEMVAAGADILVAGTSSWFNPSAPLVDNVARTEKAIAAGLELRQNQPAD
jgi:ribulose-phosphate 3-epimerase